MTYVNLIEMLFDIMKELPEEIQRNYIKRIDWNSKIKSQLMECEYEFDIDFLRKYQYDINWDIISDLLCHTKEPEELIEIFREFKDSIGKEMSMDFLCSDRCDLDLIDEFYDYIDFTGLSSNKYITDEIIFEYQEELDWEILIQNHSFDKEMMGKMKRHLLKPELIRSIFLYQKLENIPEEFFTEIPSIINK